MKKFGWRYAVLLATLIGCDHTAQDSGRQPSAHETLAEEGKSRDPVPIAAVEVHPTRSAPTDQREKVEWSFGYDDKGKLNEWTDPAGKTTRISYSTDDHGHITKIVKRAAEAAPIIWAYDGQGRLMAMKDELGTVRYKYDQYGQLSSVERSGLPEISYKHDVLGRLSSYSIGNHITVGYSYDFLGRVAEIATPIGAIKYDYRAGKEEIVRTLPNGIQTTWKYECEGQLAAI